MTFDILNHLDRLAPAKGKNRYYCPVCNNDNFTIDPKSTPAKYQCWNSCSLKEIRDAIAPLPEKSPQPRQEKVWTYYDSGGNPRIQVIRKDDGNGRKQIFQKYWHRGVWRSASEVTEVVKQQSKQSVLPYRYYEAIKHGRIFWVEGEKCADLLWELGLAAITTIGGCDGIKRYGEYFGLFNEKEIVICPDQDLPGLKYAESILELYPEAKWLYAFPTDYRWEQPPAKGGLDVADWLAQGATREEILGAIGDWRSTQHKTTQNQKADLIQDSAINATDLPDRIRELLDQNLKPEELEAAKIQLRQSSLASEREFERLWKTIENQFDNDLPTSEVDLLLSAQQSSLSLDWVLPPKLAKPIDQLAKWQNLRSEVYLLSMLAAAGSLAKNGTKLVLQKAIGFEVSPNLFVAIVAESSQKKSPVLRSIVRKPLRVLASEAKNKYDCLKQQWESDRQAAKNNGENFTTPEPQQRIFSYSRATGEAILRQAARVPDQGLLCLSDELAGYFKSANQYRQGRGSDSEDLLEYYDGQGGTILRAEGIQVDIDDFNLGILGAIQPQVLQKFLGNCEDANGGWARFFFVNQPTIASELPDESEGFDLSGLLAGLYRSISQLPATEYRLSREAFQQFKQYYDRLEQQRVSESNPALRAVYGKTAGRIGKIALNLHLIEAVISGQTPAIEVSATTITRAAKIAKLAIDQIRAIYSEFAGDHLAGNLTKVVDLSRRKGEVKARDVQQAFTRSARPDSTTVRQWFVQLCECGYGSLSGEGRSLGFTAYQERRIEPVGDPPTQTEPELVDFVDSFELREADLVDSEILVDKFVSEYKIAAEQNGRSTLELTRITHDLKRFSKEIRNRVWKRLPIELQKRIQVEVLGKPLNRKEVF